MAEALSAIWSLEAFWRCPTRAVVRPPRSIPSAATSPSVIYFAIDGKASESSVALAAGDAAGAREPWKPGNYA